MPETAGSLFRNNPAVQLVEQCAKTLILVGVLPLAAAARTSSPMRRWLFVPGVSLLVLTVAGALGVALPTHDFWRIPAMWALLLVPFAAMWIAGGGGYLSPSSALTRSLMTVLFVAPAYLQSAEMTRISSLSPWDLALGRRLDALIRACPDPGQCRVLVDNHAPGFVHLVVASQHPEASVYTEPVLDAPQPLPVIPYPASADIKDLAANRIRYVVLWCSPSNPGMPRNGMRASGTFGRWQLDEINRGPGTAPPAVPEGE